MSKNEKEDIKLHHFSYFFIVGADSNTTGNATLICTENWNCNVTATNKTACLVESKIKNIGDKNVTTKKSFKSAIAGDVMLKGDDCKAICANCTKEKSSASSLSLYGLGIAGTMALLSQVM